ncbi:MAG TPA: zinc-dependent metalloprotease [Actinomycetota bacterium]|nr:zinc-dependent metalloprotease [Actinomycetota bacterium]
MDPAPGERPEVPLGDILGDVPLLREIQRVLLASTGPINWELARQIGIAVAAWGGEDRHPTPEEVRSLEEAVRMAELAVADFTGLPTPPELTRVEVLSRGRWVEANTRSLPGVLDPVGARLAAVIGEAATAELRAVPAEMGGSPEVFRELMRRVAPLLLGAQVGAVLGHLSHRVLGQFDLGVPRPGGSLYFVAPNIARFEKDWSLPPVEFRAWVALHEVTHRFEFARPWVAPHFAALVRDLVEHAELDLASLERRLEGVDLADPEAFSRALEGVGNLFGHATTTEQRLRVQRVQAFVAVAEGYGDHVTGAIARRILPSSPRIEEALRRHREGRPGGEALERLLGLEVTLEQYRLGAAFCQRVAELTDEATLARVWESPEALPSMPELEEPRLWLARMT